MEKTTQSEHEELLSIMKEFSDTGFEPKVGIFWYNFIKKELFDVLMKDASDIEINNGKGTINKLHKDYWAKNYHRAKAQNKKVSIYYEDYTQIPRGRIFIVNGEFKVYVGHWVIGIEDIVRDLIQFTFDIPKFDFVIDEHWDIGHGWSEI